MDAGVNSQKPPPDPRDAAAALVAFKSGATGLLATVRAAPMFCDIHVFGSKGWAKRGEETMLTVAMVGEEPQTTTYPQVDLLATLIKAFAETVETGKPFPVTTSDMLDVRTPPAIGDWRSPSRGCKKALASICERRSGEALSKYQA